LGLGTNQGEDEIMSTWITIEVEVGVDVPQDALGMWIAEQLNHPREAAERSEEEEAGLEALDDYQGPVTVMWWDPQPERSRA
jgi:hypothetical protein